MDHLFHLRDSILGYISPAKYRRRTLLPTTPSNKLPAASRPLRSNMALTEPKDEKTRAVIAGRVSKKYISPHDTKGQRPKPKRRGSGSSLYKYEGGSDASDELMDHRSRSQYPEANHVLLAPPPEVILDTVEVDEVDIDDTISVEDKVNQFLDHQREVRKTQDIDEKDGWHEDELALFNELSMRGLQPLLPAHWRSDFRTCPPALFSFNIDDTFLNAVSGNEFRGSNALVSLVTLGGRVRSVMTGSRTREEIIKKEIENYIKWSEYDGGYQHKHFLPIITLVVGKPGQDMTEVARIMTDQLDFLAEHHRENLLVDGEEEDNGRNTPPVLYTRTPPLIYGVVITKSIVVFITLDAAKVGSKPRTIAHFDFSNGTMDVWNGFAVAILVVSIRNYMISIREHLDDESPESSDPDA